MSAVKTHTALHPAALSRLGRDEFVDLIPQSQRIFLELLERDYALTRFVAANCAASGDFAEKATPLAIKGGFAIRHVLAQPKVVLDAGLTRELLGELLQGPRFVRKRGRIPVEAVSGHVARIAALSDASAAWESQIGKMLPGAQPTLDTAAKECLAGLTGRIFC